VLAGLSTGVAQGYATGRQMYAAARALGPAVQGYWLCLNAHDPRAVADAAQFLGLEHVP
jgi:hypothetical protein